MNPFVSGPDADTGASTFAAAHWDSVLTPQGRSPAADTALEDELRHLIAVLRT
jgi:hypothetical protein